MDVFIWSPSPHKSCHMLELRQWVHKLVGWPWWSANGPVAPTTPNIGCQAVLGCLVLIPCVMAYPKLIFFGLWACLDPIEPEHVLWLVDVFCLGLRSVFPCSWSVFSALFHLHTNIYQHSWKWLVINPYHYVDVYILCICVGVDDLNLVLKSRQHMHVPQVWCDGTSSFCIVHFSGIWE